MDDKGLMTAQEVADYLGISEATVRRYLNRGKIKGYRLGNRWRIKRDDVEAYLSERRS